MGYYKQKQILEEEDFVPEKEHIIVETTKDVYKRNANNRNRGKVYERKVAAAIGGVRNLDKRYKHLDVYNETTCYEVKSTQAKVPAWIDSAMQQCEKASAESGYEMGGIIKVWTQGKARAFLIKEIDLTVYNWTEISEKDAEKIIEETYEETND
jgi:hypothetical protein